MKICLMSDYEGGGVLKNIHLSDFLLGRCQYWNHFPLIKHFFPNSLDFLPSSSLGSDRTDVASEC